MHLHFDTDIGTDVDDALALGVLLGSPEIDIAAITTVYGDTVLRARLASRLVGIAARGEAASASAGTSGDPSTPAVPVSPGESQTRSGKPVWWPGHEGALHDDLERERIDTRPGVLALVDAAARLPGELDVLAVGPLTNIALALDTGAGFEANVRRLIVMGGDFGPDNRPEHNFVSDIDAAQRVFGSRLEIVVGGLDLTMQVTTRPEDVASITSAGPFGRALGDEIAQWWRFNGQEWNTPHDPILAAYLLRPELFTAVRSTVRIDSEGRSWHQPSDDGTVTVLTSMDAGAVLDLMIERICAADAARV